MACQDCGNPTNNTCTRCGVSKYCDGNCQSRNWPLHKNTCKDNQLGQALERVARILHEAYLAFRENVWDTPIQRIENSTQTLTVYDGNQAQNTAYFTAFPNDLVQNDHQVKMELLTAWTCNEPQGFFPSLIEKLLQGLNIDIAETTVHLLNPMPRSITAVLATGKQMTNMAYKHDILHLRSRRPGNREWVIDLCGAQYGIYQPFHDGAQYFNQYVQSTYIRQNLGDTNAYFSTQARERGFRFLPYRLGIPAAQALTTAMNTWELQNIPLSQLRTLTGANFDQQMANFLTSLDNAVHTFVATNDFTAVVRREREWDRRQVGR